MAALLEHYGLIGDTTTVALISRGGSLDWLCLPRIDSDACFARLLGTDDHGYWTIRPAAEVRGIARRYRADTLILETEVTCDGGLVRVIANDPRMLTTIAAIEKGLTSDGFVYRYATETGVDGLAIRHDPGLLAEEYHPGLHRQLGNFPQAFSHVGIVASAFRLAAKREGRWRSFPAAMADVA